MPLLPFKEFSEVLSMTKGRLVGCDVGEKTIGLALSDISRMVASPLEVLHRTQWKKDSKTLLNIIEHHRIIGVVVGLPLNMNGSEGPRCQSVRQFVSNFLNLTDLPFCFWDERLSTVAATRVLLEADLSRAKRSKVVDKVAAAYILQGCLDSLSRNSIS